MLPSPDRDPDDIGDKLGFRYSTFSIEDDNSIVIKIEFENPEDMSMEKNSDQLKLEIDRSEFEKAFIIMGTSNRIIELPADQKIDVSLDIPP